MKKLIWQDDTEMSPTEFGDYMIEWNDETDGYEAVLWDENDEVIWHSEPINVSIHLQVDYKAIAKCRRLAQKDYEQRLTKR
jgi:hypothetical protein